MTSLSPLFSLLPQDDSGNSEWMSRHHGVVCSSRCSPPQWQGPYTDMMCLTKAADEDQGNIQKEQSRKINEETKTDNMT